jgi:hypothetical protein
VSDAFGRRFTGSIEFSGVFGAEAASVAVSIRLSLRPDRLRGRPASMAFAAREGFALPASVV